MTTYTGNISGVIFGPGTSEVTGNAWISSPLTMAANGTLINDGSFLAGASMWYASNNAFINEAGATLTFDYYQLIGSLNNYGSVTFENDNYYAIFNGLNNTGSMLLSNAAVSIFGSVANSGSIEISSGHLTVSAGVSGGGQVKLDAGGVLELAGQSSLGVNFAGSSGQLILDSSASFSGTISNFAAGDSIDLKNVAPATVTLSGSQLSWSSSGNNAVTLQTAANSSGETPTISSDGTGGALISHAPTNTSSPSSYTGNISGVTFGPGTSEVTGTAWISSPLTMASSGTLINDGSFQVGASMWYASNNAFINETGATLTFDYFQLIGSLNNSGATTFENANYAIYNGVTNTGSILISNATIAFSGGVTNSGSIEVGSSDLTVSGGISGGGQVKLDAGAVLEISGPSSLDVNFTGSSGQLSLDAGTSFSGTIANFAAGDTIDLKNVAPADVTLSGSQLSWTSSGNNAVTLQAAANSSGETLGISSDGSGGALISYSGTNELSISAAIAAYQSGTLSAPAAISDSAANVAASLDKVQMIAKAGDLSSIVLTDSSVPTLAISSIQLVNDSTALSEISSNYDLSVSGVTVANAASVASASHVTSISVSDSAADIQAGLDGLETLAVEGKLSAITFTDSGMPTLTLSSAQQVSDAAALSKILGNYALDTTSTISSGTDSASAAYAAYQAGTLTSPVAVSDSAANVVADLDQLDIMAASGQLSGITLTDSGIPTLSIKPVQLVADSVALSAISTYFTLSIDASAANLTFTGLSGHGNTAVFTGAADDYSIAAAANGGVTVTDTGTGRTSVDVLNNVQALQFSDGTDIVAQTPGSGAPGTVTTGNITELYGAVFGRVPDVAGLAYYEKELAANPSTSLTAFAEAFLQSPEYTGNSAHNYAQTAAGEAQFITDSYNNLLRRAPEASAVPYYQNLISTIVGNLTPGTAAYAQADLLAHATVLVDFSASTEFLNNVQVTAQNPSSASHWLVLV